MALHSGGSPIGAQGVFYNVAQWAIPFIQPASHTMGNNGALTSLATALNVAYPGAWCWFATNQIFSGSVQGWYWTVWSSTTACTVFNVTYSSGTPGVGTQVAFVSTGPGSNTGTTSEVFGPTITIAANTMGANGIIEYSYSASANAGSAKTYRVHYSASGGTVVCQQAPTTGGSGAIGFIQNQGVTNKSVAANIQAITADSVVTSYPNVDTTVATSVVMSINKSAAADNAVIERGYVAVGFGQ